MIRKLTAVSTLALLIAACASTSDERAEAKVEAAAAQAEAAAAEAMEMAKAEAEKLTDEAMDKAEGVVDEAKEAMSVEPMTLKAVLEAQPEEAKARYVARHPEQTLELMGVEPGMTVVEALPGGGWYTKILLPYLGTEGKLIAGQYPGDIWARFGFGEEWAQARVERDAKWVEQASEWAGEAGSPVGATTLTTFEGVEDGSVDVVLFIRALHNLNRFSAETGYMKDVLASSMRALKPGGAIGVVQHRAPADNPDEWADGSAGYLKQQAVIDMFTAAGFVLEAASELNANAKDKPTAEDIVWRLPPTLNGQEEGSESRATALEIGESDRMTLVFRKPA